MLGTSPLRVLFSAFILVNGIVTLPAGYLADRWNRTKAMAVVIVAWSIISALGGLVPTSAFGLLLVIRASLGFGQAVTDPSGQQRHRRLLRYGTPWQGLFHSAMPELCRAWGWVWPSVAPSDRCFTVTAGGWPSSSRSSRD